MSGKMPQGPKSFPEFGVMVLVIVALVCLVLSFSMGVVPEMARLAEMIAR